MGVAFWVSRWRYIILTSDRIHACLCLAGTRRTAIPHFLRNEAKNRGWTFISSDYRLLIPATGQDILDDVHSLFGFLSTNVPQVDMNRVAVGGGSAGGYVARLAALYGRPRPKVFYSLYGSECIRYRHIYIC
jgi:acetyl esterase/lipase